MHTEKHACVPRVGQICPEASVLPVCSLAFLLTLCAVQQ